MIGETTYTFTQVAEDGALVTRQRHFSSIRDEHLLLGTLGIKVLDPRRKRIRQFNEQDLGNGNQISKHKRKPDRLQSPHGENLDRLSEDSSGIETNSDSEGDEHLRKIEAQQNQRTKMELMQQKAKKEVNRKLPRTAVQNIDQLSLLQIGKSEDIYSAKLPPKVAPAALNSSTIPFASPPPPPPPPPPLPPPPAPLVFKAAQKTISPENENVQDAIARLAQNMANKRKGSEIDLKVADNRREIQSRKPSLMDDLKNALGNRRQSIYFEDKDGKYRVKKNGPAPLPKPSKSGLVREQSSEVIVSNDSRLLESIPDIGENISVPAQVISQKEEFSNFVHDTKPMYPSFTDSVHVPSPEAAGNVNAQSQDDEMSQFLRNAGLVSPAFTNNVHAVSSSSKAVENDDYIAPVAEALVAHPKDAFGSLVAEEQAIHAASPKEILISTSLDGVMEFASEKDEKMNFGEVQGGVSSVQQITIIPAAGTTVVNVASANSYTDVTSATSPNTDLAKDNFIAGFSSENELYSSSSNSHPASPIAGVATSSLIAREIEIDQIYSGIRGQTTLNSTPLVNGETTLMTHGANIFSNQAKVTEKRPVKIHPTPSEEFEIDQIYAGLRGQDLQTAVDGNKVEMASENKITFQNFVPKIGISPETPPPIKDDVMSPIKPEVTHNLTTFPELVQQQTSMSTPMEVSRLVIINEQPLNLKNDATLSEDSMNKIPVNSTSFVIVNSHQIDDNVAAASNRIDNRNATIEKEEEEVLKLLESAYSIGEIEDPPEIQETGNNISTNSAWNTKPGVDKTTSKDFTTSIILEPPRLKMEKPKITSHLDEPVLNSDSFASPIVYPSVIEYTAKKRRQASPIGEVGTNIREELKRPLESKQKIGHTDAFDGRQHSMLNFVNQKQRLDDIEKSTQIDTKEFSKVVGSPKLVSKIFVNDNSSIQATEPLKPLKVDHAKTSRQSREEMLSSNATPRRYVQKQPSVNSRSSHRRYQGTRHSVSFESNDIVEEAQLMDDPAVVLPRERPHHQRRSQSQGPPATTSRQKEVHPPFLRMLKSLITGDFGKPRVIQKSPSIDQINHVAKEIQTTPLLRDHAPRNNMDFYSSMPVQRDLERQRQYSESSPMQRNTFSHDIRRPPLSFFHSIVSVNRSSDRGENKFDPLMFASDNSRNGADFSPGGYVPTSSQFQQNRFHSPLNFQNGQRHFMGGNMAKTLNSFRSSNTPSALLLRGSGEQDVNKLPNFVLESAQLNNEAGRQGSVGMTPRNTGPELSHSSSMPRGLSQSLNTGASFLRNQIRVNDSMDSKNSSNPGVNYLQDKQSTGGKSKSNFWVSPGDMGHLNNKPSHRNQISSAMPIIHELNPQSNWTLPNGRERF